MAYVQGRSESLYEFLAGFKPALNVPLYLSQASQRSVGLLTRDVSGAF